MPAPILSRPQVPLAAALLALAGCLSAPAQPQAVTVSAAGIAVAMSDRSTCRGVAPVPGADWSGVLSGCDSPYPYRVVFDRSANPLRAGLVAVAEAAGLTLAPVATVEIDGPAGNTWRFASPPPVESDR